MSEEHTTEIREPSGETHTHTIVHETAERRSGGAGWAIAIVLALAIVVGAYIFTQGNGAEIAKDTAIAGAAEDVGNAAQSIGDAADAAADRIAE